MILIKKIIFILALLISCFLIFKFTTNNKEYYVSIGDSIAKGNTPYNASGYGYSDFIKKHLSDHNNLKGYDKSFTDAYYRIIDLIHIIEDNEEIDEKITINQLLNKATILTISVGMNELYYKLNINSDNIYTYIDDMINDYDELLKMISKYHINKVFLIGYYNITEEDNLFFNYANYGLKELAHKYSYIFIDTSKLLKEKKKYFEDSEHFNPNIEGYRKISENIIEKL